MTLFCTLPKQLVHYHPDLLRDSFVPKLERATLDILNWPHVVLSGQFILSLVGYSLSGHKESNLIEVTYHEPFTGKLVSCKLNKDILAYY